MVGTLTLADVTNERGIHLTIYATGCIFHYDKDFPQDSGIGFKESDTPNFIGSYYSRTKVQFRMQCHATGWPESPIRRRTALQLYLCSSNPPSSLFAACAACSAFDT